MIPAPKRFPHERAFSLEISIHPFRRWRLGYQSACYPRRLGWYRAAGPWRFSLRVAPFFGHAWLSCVVGTWALTLDGGKL